MYQVSRKTFMEIVSKVSKKNDKPLDTAEEICKLIETEINVWQTFAKQVQAGVWTIKTVLSEWWEDIKKANIARAVKQWLGQLDEQWNFVPSRKVVVDKEVLDAAR